MRNMLRNLGIQRMWSLAFSWMSDASWWRDFNMWAGEQGMERTLSAPGWPWLPAPTGGQLWLLPILKALVPPAQHRTFAGFISPAMQPFGIAQGQSGHSTPHQCMVWMVPWPMVWSSISSLSSDWKTLHCVPVRWCMQVGHEKPQF